jgi:hypothetical protein
MNKFANLRFEQLQDFDISDMIFVYTRTIKIAS